MNIIATMFEEFLNILGAISKRKAKEDAERSYKKAYALAFKDGYSAGYDDATNKIPHRFVPQAKPKIEMPTTLVLFIKADRGSTIIDIIRNSKSLVGISSDQLVSDAFRVWAGTEKQYNSISFNSIFSCESDYSEVGKEYDSVAIVLPYPKNSDAITPKSDSFSIAEVIREAVNQGLSCKIISNRISFQKIEGLPLMEV